jgi:uncharacterized protein DUF6977
MAKRPVFLPTSTEAGLVRRIDLGITWHSGFAPSQKKKNVKALHDAASRIGYAPILEISTKSDDVLGYRLSAFNLKIETDDYGIIPLECAYQGSKVFEQGGPYSDLCFNDPRAAKKDVRLTTSGRLIAFDFLGERFPLTPKTAFYDWLYVTSLTPQREIMFGRIEKYAGFTDIEFNPEKSINCQAHSCALFVSLIKNSLLEAAVRSPDAFIAVLSKVKGEAGNQEQQKLVVA